ncbi:hypothetical protein [Nostoc sp. UHCC 0252]|uniref:hypothetical protein n=1 Tax=Nostoc sp. UHCC 0252 TaxID=3110241 RepID=UPI002B214135|nr:hypothetical protein [Nostoc sp. UHCC 0252]MEA5601723.1 hypothetical protein [Nostoc sp. UHCC 0252]
MIHRNSFLPIFLFVGIPLTVLFAYFGLNYSGFCFAKMRYLSDEERFRMVFDYQNERTDLGRSTYKYIKYASFDEYIKENTDCCSINPGGPYEIRQSSFLDRIFGYDARDVIVINFKVRYLDETGNQRAFETRFENTLQNCGHPQ